MNDAEDQKWLAALAGRASGSDAATEEADRLRQALKSRLIPAPELQAVTSAAREAELLARARREGLLQTRKGGAWRTRWLAAAASVLVVGFGLAQYLKTRTDDVMVMRAANDGVARVVVASPAAAQAELLSALRTAGIDARGYTFLGRYGVDAELTSSAPPAVLQLLRGWRVSLPADGLLQVEFEAARPQ